MATSGGKVLPIWEEAEEWVSKCLLEEKHLSKSIELQESNAHWRGEDTLFQRLRGGPWGDVEASSSQDERCFLPPLHSNPGGSETMITHLRRRDECARWGRRSQTSSGPSWQPACSAGCEHGEVVSEDIEVESFIYSFGPKDMNCPTKTAPIMVDPSTTWV